MDEIEMKNRNDPPPEDENQEAETAFDNDDRDEETNELETDDTVGTNKVKWEDDRDNYNKFKKKIKYTYWCGRKKKNKH